MICRGQSFACGTTTITLWNKPVKSTENVGFPWTRNGVVQRSPALQPRIIPELIDKAKPTLAHDSSTNTLIRRSRKTK
jgi:hypothetical protein